jgi:hypothetical protein
VGCTSCKSKSGCDHRKGDMFASIDRALERLYPTRTWGEPADTLLDVGDSGDVAALADELALELRAATFVRHGDDDEACDFVYVLCLGRAPCIIQVRDHGVEPPAEWGSGVDRVDELYLRACASQRAPFAGVQQVAIEAVRAPGGWLISERPRAGVYDAPLLARMQKLVATLPAYGLEHLDFGEISHAPPGFHAGAWRDRFGGEPAIANYLFYAQPTTMVATTWVASRHEAEAEAAAR